MSDNNQVLDSLFKPAAESNIKDEIICIVDRSGSMNAICSDAEGGLNAFIKEQKEIEGGANFTLVEFNNTTDKIYDRVDISTVEDYKLRPYGGTALLDAIGLTLSDYPETEGNKVVVIVTDGEENASREYSREVIFNMITELTEKGWDFLFLAANQDAISAGGSLGIDAAHTMNFAYSDEGTHDAYAAMNTYTSSVRTKGKAAAIDDLNIAKLNSKNIS